MSRKHTLCRFCALAMTAFLLIGTAMGCAETGKTSPVTTVAAASESSSTKFATAGLLPTASVATAPGIAATTSSAQVDSPDLPALNANPKNVWFYDKDIKLPFVLYNKAGQRYSMILCSDYDDGKTYNATREAVWQVANPAVASVDGGIVTPLSSGKSTITARYGKFKAKTTLTVFDGLPDGIIVDDGPGEVSAGKDPLELRILLVFGKQGEYSADGCMSVYNSSPKIANVTDEDGRIMVYGLKAGKAEIIVSAFGLSQIVYISAR